MKEETTLKEKLLDFQGKVEAIAKNSENPFFKQNYFDINKLIEDVKPILNECGILLLQPLTHIDGSPALQTILTDTKESMEFTIPLPQDPNPQKQGANITYFRRYALTSLLFLQAEDDDASSTSTHHGKATTKTTKPEPQKEISHTHTEKSAGDPITDKQKAMIERIIENAVYMEQDLLEDWEVEELQAITSKDVAIQKISGWLGDVKKSVIGERTKRIEQIKKSKQEPVVAISELQTLAGSRGITDLSSWVFKYFQGRELTDMSDVDREKVKVKLEEL